MTKKKRVMKGRRSKSGRKSGGRGPSNKPKHSKVAKLKKLAKMRARNGKSGKGKSKKRL